MTRPQCITTLQAYEELLMENLAVIIAFPVVLLIGYLAYRTLK
jgi:hypothetical protein